jgi:hypothetical protein
VRGVPPLIVPADYRLRSAATCFTTPRVLCFLAGRSGRFRQPMAPAPEGVSLVRQRTVFGHFAFAMAPRHAGGQALPSPGFSFGAQPAGNKPRNAYYVLYVFGINIACILINWSAWQTLGEVTPISRQAT